MAVIVTRNRSVVVGDRRWMLQNINIGASGQTLVSPLHSLESELADANGSTIVNASVATAGGQGPITFNYSGGGAQNGVALLVVGR